MATRKDGDELNTWIGERIRQARLGVGATQTELGEVVGLTRASIANIEVGRQNISADKLVALARHLKVSLDTLLPPRSAPARTSAPMPVDDTVRLRAARRKAASTGIALAEAWLDFQDALTELGAARRELP